MRLSAAFRAGLLAPALVLGACGGNGSARQQAGSKDCATLVITCRRFLDTDYGRFLKAWPEAYVTVRSGDSSLVVSSQADSVGVASFGCVPWGTYSVRAAYVSNPNPADKCAQTRVSLSRGSAASVTVIDTVYDLGPTPHGR